MRRILWVAAFTVAMVVTSALPAFAGPLRDPADILRENDASNLGICSVELGRQGVRDDVARTLAQQGDAFGLKNPGELYSARAQERGGDEECVRRR